MTDAQSLFRSALLTSESVETEFGTFWVRTYPVFEGMNPLTGELVIVSPKQLLFLSPAADFQTDVLDRTRPLQAPVRANADAAPYVSVADDYVAIVEQLRKTKVTKVASPDAWAATDPEHPVPWHDLGCFAVFRGPEHDDTAQRSAIVFRQSDELAIQLRTALGA